MGLYLSERSAHGNAEWLVNEKGAIRLPHAPVQFTDQVAIIAIIDNGPFEAIAWVSKPEYLEDFTNPREDRPIEWLIMDSQTAVTLVRIG